MTKEVILSISGFQTDLDNKSDVVEVISFGNYYLKNGKHYVKYEEVNEEQNEITSSLLKFTKDKVELKRQGTLNANMEFEEGVKNVTCYHTQFGDLSIGFATNEINIEETQDKIIIDIDYNLEVNGENTGRCKVNIKIEPQHKNFTI